METPGNIIAMWLWVKNRNMEPRTWIPIKGIAKSPASPQFHVFCGGSGDPNRKKNNGNMENNSNLAFWGQIYLKFDPYPRYIFRGLRKTREKPKLKCSVAMAKKSWVLRGTLTPKNEKTGTTGQQRKNWEMLESKGQSEPRALCES